MDFVKKYWGLLALALVVLWGVSWYNSAVTLDEDSSKGWSQVESAYQRRADLIPNLVNTVKGYAAHEKEVLMGVTEARAKVGQVNIDGSKLTADNIAAFKSAQSGLTSALSKLMVVMERYPDLKANQNYLQLQAQLEGTENRINVARSRYSEVVAAYNSKIRRLPGKFFNLVVGFEVLPQYEADAGSEKAPEVKF